MNIKTSIRILLGLFIPLLFVACEDDTAQTPHAGITINKTTFTLNESMVINFTGTADQVVIYTGDDTHNYELRTQSNTGTVVNKGVFTYAYSVPGTYKVVCVASTYLDMGKDLKTDTTSIVVKVVDDVTEIERLSAKVFYDEVYADKFLNDKWLLNLPYKIKYNNKELSVKLKQKLNFDITSDSTSIFIDNVPYSEKTNYDLSAPLDVLVHSYAGTERLYKLYTLYYPEFKTFKLANVKGTLIRNEFDYASFELQVTLPSGTEANNNLIPEFETYSATDKVYIGEEEQISGSSAVDFTQEVVYRLVSTVSDNPDMQAVTTINVKIAYQ